MLKKIVLAITVVAAAMLSVSAVFAAEEDFVVDGGMITNYTGSDSELVVPAVINGVEIAGIDSGAFSGNNSLTHVIISEGIEVIERYAFENCESLITVDCPKSMLVIALDAFSGCYALEELNVEDTTRVEFDYSINLTDTGDEIDGFLVSGSSVTGYVGEDTDVVIPSTLGGVKITAIGANAFKDKTAITSVTIPETVTTIGDYAFSGCSKMKTVSLPNSLQTLGKYVFYNCTALQSVQIPGKITKLGNYIFSYCTALKSVEFKSGFTKTGDFMFDHCTSLTSVKFPSTMKVINTYAFNYCKILPTVTIPNGLTTIGDAAFYYCNALNNINVPDTVTYMGTHSFRACFALSNIKLSKNIPAINYRAFDSCSMKTLEIPQKVQTIGKEAFWSCQQLEKIEIPKNVRSIGDRAFCKTSKLTDVVIYNGVTSMGSFVFDADGTNKTQSPKVIIYTPLNSYAQKYAKNNGLKCRQINVATVTGVASGNSLGIVAEFNYPFEEKIQKYGVKYIPAHLYGTDAEVLDIAYDTDVIEADCVKSYMTMMTDIPEQAINWRFIAKPYMLLKDGNLLEGEPKIFSKKQNIYDYEEEVQ